MSSRPARERHVHLGTRLLWVERIRRGEASCEQAAAELGVAVELVRRWLQRHAGERPMTIDEIVMRPDVLRLTKRAERLAQLIAMSESTLRTLNQLLRNGVAPKDEPQGD